MNWHQVLQLIENGDLIHFGHLPHGNDKLTLLNILFATFSSSRPHLQQNLIEQNLHALVQHHAQSDLLLYNLCVIVATNPKYYKRNYDFRIVNSIPSDAAIVLRQILQSKKQRLVQQSVTEHAEEHFRLLGFPERIKTLLKSHPTEVHNLCRKKIQAQTPTIFTNQRIDELISEYRYVLEKHHLVILLGPYSSGKSTLAGSGITIHVDSTVDFGSLVGTYVCSRKLGVFEFQDGPLMLALKEGQTLIIKNIQEAQDELLIELSRLQQRKSLTVQGSTHYAHKNFRIVGLASIPDHPARLRSHLAQYFEEGMILDVPAYERVEMLAILEFQYPLIFQEPLITLLQNVVESANLFRGYLKLGKRVLQHVATNFGEQKIGSLYLTEQLRRKLFMDARECLGLELLDTFGLHVEELPTLTEQYDPQIRVFETYVSTDKLGQVRRDMFISDVRRNNEDSAKIIYTLYSSRIIEKLLTCLAMNEPCLLVGDTGCGKTTLTQHCASLFGKRLHVFNLSEGSDAQDLIGGFRPLDLAGLLKRLFQRFLKHFAQQADLVKNQQFLGKMQDLLQKGTIKCYRLLVKAMQQTCASLNMPKLRVQLDKLALDQRMSFHFLTGNLIKAMRRGDWVLIDEINLANNELLQKLQPAIEGKPLLFFERGDREAIAVHPHFRLIGCMNPGSDVGKKELPANIKNKFTALRLDEMTNLADVVVFVQGFGLNVNAESMATFYLTLKSQTNGPHYSLRNLARALHYMKRGRFTNETLFNGLALGFGSGLTNDEMTDFTKRVECDFKIKVHLPKEINYKVGEQSVQVYGFTLEKGEKLLMAPDQLEFLVTDGNLQPLLSLLRAVSGTGLPVLLEGPTSAGKTSLVQYVANLIGQQCHRINNHQNTDIEEYLGSYTSINGEIRFQEGLLVKALRNGDWVILDELNLARSEILEHLNRLLDDNQELFLPETQTVLRPHRRFRIFATQNPVTYAGRKMLSKAFRNRFIQINVGDIQVEDMAAILRRRCVYVPPSHVPLMLQTYREVNLHRSSEHLLMQRCGMITLRDLIKWGTRMQSVSVDNPKEALALEGYCLLVERLRDHDTRTAIQRILETIFNLRIETRYDEYVQKHFTLDTRIQWNTSFTRMAALTLKSLNNKEPVLLIGPAGVGKTTLANLLGQLMGVISRTLVAHQYLEISDFVGALRPVRSNQEGIFEWQDGPLLQCVRDGGVFLIDEINMCPESVLEGLNSVLEIPASLTVNDQMYTTDRNFVVIGAMNPSGDWGKKELTPALRSRFTEIYVQNPLTQLEEIRFIVGKFFDEDTYVRVLSEVFEQYNQNFRLRMNLNELTYRDLINIKQVIEQLRRKFQAQAQDYIMYSLEINILLGLRNEIHGDHLEEIKAYFARVLGLQAWPNTSQVPTFMGDRFGCEPFTIPVVCRPTMPYCLGAQPANLVNLLKAISLEGKPVMVSGPVSCGKTSSIEYVAKLLGVRTILVVLDEHTDLQELIGMDQPTESQKFRFVPGPLLQGIIEGAWVLLKHLNMAPQNVLEGLNSIFDHRQEVFVPEVGQTYAVHPQCKLFAVQNPMHLGGGRKGLPASFLNRFVKVNYQAYTEQDYVDIAAEVEPSLQREKIAAYHQPNLSLVSYLKYFRALVCCEDEALVSSCCLGSTDPVGEQLLYRILARDLDLVTAERDLLYRLLLSQRFIKSTNTLGTYINGPTKVLTRLAETHRKKLRYLRLSSTADSSDLLGSYDQYSEEGMQQLTRRKQKYQIATETLVPSSQHSVFVWTDSQLVQAIENGDWIVIEDVGHVNPTILPKLVPIVRCIRGDPVPLHTHRQIVMHHEFQIFFTDPKHTINPNLDTIRSYCYNFDLRDTMDPLDALQIEFQLYPEDMRSRVVSYLLGSTPAQIEEFKLTNEPLLALNEPLPLTQQQQLPLCSTLPFKLYVPVFTHAALEDRSVAEMLFEVWTHMNQQLPILDQYLVEIGMVDSISYVTHLCLPYVSRLIAELAALSQEHFRIVSTADALLEVYQRNIMSFPTLLKRCLEWLIGQFEGTSIDMLLSIQYTLQTVDNPERFAMACFAARHALTGMEEEQSGPLELALAELQTSIKSTMPKQQADLAFMHVLAMICGNIKCSTVNESYLRFRVIVAQLGSLELLIPHLMQDIRNQDCTWAQTISYLNSISPIDIFITSLQQLVDQSLTLSTLKEGVVAVTLNEFQRTSYMTPGSLLCLRSLWDESQECYLDNPTTFTSTYRLLEYGKGVRDNIFEVVLPLSARAINLIEYGCMLVNGCLSNNLVHPESVLLHGQSTLEDDLHLHVLMWEQGNVNLGEFTRTLRDSLFRASISQLDTLMRIADQFMIACCNSTTVHSNPRLAQRTFAKSAAFLERFGLPNNEESLMQVFVAASAVFRIADDAEHMFTYVNKELIEGERLRSLIHNRDHRVSARDRAYYIITHQKLANPPADDLDQRLQQTLSKVVLRGNTDTITLTEQFISENGHQTLKLQEVWKHSRTQFVNLARQWIVACYRKHFLAFKDLLIPILYPLMLLCDLVASEDQSEKQPEQPEDFLTSLLLGRDLQTVSKLGKQIFFTDLERDEDLLAADKFRNYLLTELQSLIKDEYTKDTEAPKQIDIKEYVTAELNDLEIHSNELMRYFIGDARGLALSMQFVASITSSRSNLTRFSLLGLADERPEVTALLIDSIRRTMDTPHSTTNIFRDSSVTLSRALDTRLRSLLRQVNTLLEDPLFQENQMLFDIAVSALSILEQPACSMPVIKFISMVETVIDRIDQWDNCVPRQYHLKAQNDELIQLYVDYKQLEKHAWRHTMQKRVTELWSVESIVGLKMYETIHTTPDQTALLNLLWSFLSSSTLGSFEMRYHILRRLQCEPWSNEVSIVLCQVMHIVDVHVKAYNEFTQASLKEFESEFREEMNLMSWRSANYTLLRQASLKMNQRIAKQIKRLSGHFEAKFAAKVQAQLCERTLVNTFEGFVGQLKPAKAMPRVRAKGAQLPLKKPKLIATSTPSNMNALWVHYETTISDYHQRMRELKEGDAKQNIKQRTLEEFFKYAESVMGLKTTSKSSQLQGFTLFQAMIPVNVEITDAGLKEQIHKSLGYYYTAVQCIQGVLAQGKMNQSIPAQLLKKGIAILLDLHRHVKKHLTTSIQIIKLFEEGIQKQIECDCTNLPRIMNLLGMIHAYATAEESTIIASLNVSCHSKDVIKLSELVHSMKQRFAVNQSPDFAFQKAMVLEHLNDIAELIPSLPENPEVQNISTPATKRLSKLLRILNTKYSQGLAAGENPENEATLQRTETKYVNTLHLLVKQLRDESSAVARDTLLTLVQNSRSGTKFFLLLARVICNLYVNGFCSGEAQEGQGTEFKEGTGVGEGKGQDNVTKEIEFEEQVLGEDKQEQQEDHVSGQDKNEMDMENNFEGENDVEEQQEEEDKQEANENQDVTDSSVQDDAEQQQNNLDEEAQSGEPSQGDNEDMEYSQNEQELQPQKQDEAVDRDDDVFSLDSREGDGEPEMEEENYADNEQNEEDSEEQEGEQKEDGQNVEEMKEIENDEELNDEELNDENDEGPQEEQIDEEQEGDVDDDAEEEEQQGQEEQQPDEQNDQSSQEHVSKMGEDAAEEKDEHRDGDGGNDGAEEKQQQEKEKKESKSNLEGTNDQQEGQGQDTSLPQDQKEQQKVQEMVAETEAHADDVLQANANVQETQQPQPTNQSNDAVLQADSNVIAKLASQFNKHNLKVAQEQVEVEEQNDQAQGGMEIESELKPSQQQTSRAEGNERNEGTFGEQMEIDYEGLPQPIAVARSALSEAWVELSPHIHQQASLLCEELKVVLHPTKCQALKGDYKTGKRLNMKKVIPFIASNYKKDKIWLRRTLPSKRTYQIMIALDNSLSMRENNVDNSALQSLLAIVLALQKMEVGQLSIARFGNTTEILKPFSSNVIDCPQLMREFQFDAEGTQSQDLSLVNFMLKSLKCFDEERSSHYNEVCDQLCFIISDGRLNKKILHPLCKRAEQQSILYVFIIVDAHDEASSIYNIKSTNYVTKNGQRKLIIQRYLEDFPFPYYIVIKEFAELNKPLVNVIRQYFQLRNDF